MWEGLDDVDIEQLICCKTLDIKSKLVMHLPHMR